MTNYLTHMQSVSNKTSFERRVSYLRHNYSSVLSKLPDNPAILEIGPGNGELPSLLNQMGITAVDLVDNDSAVLNYCQSHYQVRKVFLTKGDSPGKILKSKYDLIVLTQVFEHLPKSEYSTWLKGLYRVLKPGGSIIITVPNGANPLVGTERYGDLQHENIFTIFSFRELMTFADLKNSSYQIKGFEIPPTNPLNLIRILLQKTLHTFFIILMIINGAIYQTLMTPNITLLIKKNSKK